MHQGQCPGAKKWSEGLPRFEGIETAVEPWIDVAPQLSEGLPRFEGIETHQDTAYVVVNRGVRRLAPI